MWQKTAFEVAVMQGHLAAARCPLEQGPSVSQQMSTGSLSALLGTLRAQGFQWLTLFSEIVRQGPLTHQEWAEVPDACPRLRAALPAVVGRSAEEAAQLVHRLPSADCQRLRTAALCLARSGQRQRAQLPTPIL